MIEVKGDIFDFIGKDDIGAICITTNGIVGRDGRNPMGAGTAGEASRRWPKVRQIIGDHIKLHGNVPGLMGHIDGDGNYELPVYGLFNSPAVKCLIYSFPTKNHFKDPASPTLIKSSAEWMVRITNYYKFKKVVIPAPGVGAFTGKLNWENDVKPIIKDILDDRFLITFLENK